jgi:hypothetical protein
VAVDGFAEALGSGYLLHDLGVFVEDAGEVHHFAQIFDLGAGQQFLTFLASRVAPAVSKTGGGHAAGGAEIEVEGHGIAVADHEFDAGEAADVGDLVGIAYGGDGPVDDGEAGEFGGDEQGAFDMDVGVDEAGEDEGAASAGRVCQGWRAGG